VNIFNKGQTDNSMMLSAQCTHSYTVYKSQLGLMFAPELACD